MFFKILREKSDKNRSEIVGKIRGPGHGLKLEGVN